MSEEVTLKASPKMPEHVCERTATSWIAGFHNDLLALKASPKMPGHLCQGTATSWILILCAQSLI